MIFLAILGAMMVAAGLAGLACCIREGYRLRGSGRSPEEIRSRLGRLVLVNMVAVGSAGLGLAALTAYFLLR
ncbi:hypothetical protein BH23PSE1_BH23PSE1_03370 [soil metagenome]